MANSRTFGRGVAFTIGFFTALVAFTSSVAQSRAQSLDPTMPGVSTTATTTPHQLTHAFRGMRRGRHVSGLLSPYGRRAGYGTSRRNRNANSASATGSGGGAANSRGLPSIKIAIDQANPTAEQRAQINRLEAKADTDGKTAYADRSLTPDQYMAKMNTLNDGLIASIESTLTPAQRTRFDNYLSRRSTP